MRRRHRRLVATPELDITAFLNLMIVLVPVLLLGMVFSQVRMIELDFPGLNAGTTASVEEFALVVTLVPAGIEVADSNRGLIGSFSILNGAQDLAGLRHLLRQIKARLPDKTDLTLEVGPDVSYQTLISVMDTVRSYPTVVAASVVEAELFPNVALMDAGQDRQLVVSRGLRGGEGA